MLVRMTIKSKSVRGEGIPNLAVFITRATPDRADFLVQFLRPYYNCSFSNNLHFTPDGTSNLWHGFTDGIRRCSRMRKFIASGVELVSGQKILRGKRGRKINWISQYNAGTSATHDTHAGVYKNKKCVFAKMFFAKLQMMVLSASIKPDATSKECDRFGL